MAGTKTPPKKGEVGRPSVYTDELASTILLRIAEGEGLAPICRDEGMPHRSTVLSWRIDVPGFSDRYARAKEARAESLFDALQEIADDGRNDWMAANGDEGWAANGEHIQRSKLRIDTRKWMASKLLPAAYGDKVDHTLGVTDAFAEMLGMIRAKGSRAPLAVDGED